MVCCQEWAMQSYKDIGKFQMAHPYQYQRLDGHCSHTLGNPRWSHKENAHPHISNDGKVAIVHNGILQNSDALRKRLNGQAFDSTRNRFWVFCHYIAMALEEGKEPLEALQSVLSWSEGLGGLRPVSRIRLCALRSQWFTSHHWSRKTRCSFQVTLMQSGNIPSTGCT